MTRCLVWPAATLLAAALAASPALANGRFPQANQLVIDPLDPTHLSLRTTFGIVLSMDGGATWRWVCEESIGYTGTFDPAIAAAGGVVLAGLPSGLSRTGDGCVWSAAPEPLGKRTVIDVTADPLQPGRFLATPTPGSADPGTTTFVAVTTDGGLSWQKTGAPLPEDFAPLTIELARSAPDRIYASGLGPFRFFGYMARSDDGGGSWQEATFDMEGARGPYLSAVDPTDANRVYLRLDREVGDLLKKSDDGALHWETLLTAQGSLLGFALAPDGQQLAVGGPLDGLFIGPPGGLQKVSALSINCLAWGQQGLYACADEVRDGFSVGLSVDGGQTFTPLLRLRDLAPLDCPASTPTGSLCPGRWPAVSSLFPAAGGEGGSAGSAGGAGPAASSGSAGAGASAGGAGKPEGGAAGAQAADARALGLEGGGCSLPATPVGATGALAALAAAALRSRRARKH